MEMISIRTNCRRNFSQDFRIIWRSQWTQRVDKLRYKISCKIDQEAKKQNVNIIAKKAKIFVFAYEGSFVKTVSSISDELVYDCELFFNLKLKKTQEREAATILISSVLDSLHEASKYKENFTEYGYTIEKVVLDGLWEQIKNNHLTDFSTVKLFNFISGFVKKLVIDKMDIISDSLLERLVYGD